MTADGRDVLEHPLRAAAQRLCVTGLAPGDEDELLAALGAWEPPNGCGWQLHQGDLGWFSRFEPDELQRAVRVWRAGGCIVAVLVLDGPVVARCAIAPGWEFEAELAEQVIAEAVEGLDEGDDGLWLEPPPGPSALVRMLAARGWVRSDETWLHLWRPLTGADRSPERLPDGATIRPLQDCDLDERVALQHAAFHGSTLTVPRYRRMRAWPGHDPRLDLVCRTPDGDLVAFCVAWPGAPGTTALLEPVGTHPAHRRRGYAAATIRAAFATLAAAGVSGVAVFTPASNTAATALYTSVGMTILDYRHAFHRPAAASDGQSRGQDVNGS